MMKDLPPNERRCPFLDEVVVEDEFFQGSSVGECQCRSSGPERQGVYRGQD